MKKSNRITAITLALALCAGATVIADANVNEKAIAADDSAQVYLVPGTWYDAATKRNVANTVDGATALTAEQKAALHMENNVYFAGETGSALPVPSTTRDGYSFNGWWTIKNATVEYVDEVPEATENLYLYADFRAELSQPKDPVNPPDGAEEKLIHYLRIEHLDTGEAEMIPLFVSGTDVSGACSAGYGGPVQFYNEWFELRANDLIQVWVSRIYGADPVNAPQKRGAPEPKCGYDLESSGANRTDNYIKAYNESGLKSFLNVENPTFKYVMNETHHFRVYIKFYDDGGHLTIYMEQKD